MRILRIVLIPDTLIDTRDLTISARFLRTIAEVKSHRSLSELARIAGMSRSTASRACQHLAAQGWIGWHSTKNSRIAVPCYPDEVEKLRVELLLWEKDMAPFLGEFLMRKILDEIIASSTYMDNARPSFPINPETGQPLEIDRLYREGVGFEYNGEQHYRPTAKYDQQTVRKQVTRDIIKQGLGVRYGITIVEVTDRDLTIDTMMAKVPPSLPIRRLNRQSLYLRKLEEICWEHITTMDNIRRRQ